MSVEYRGTIAGLDNVAVRLDLAARTFVSESTAAVTANAQVNANTGAHSKGEPHIPGSGPGPNVVTGTLRRSIKPTPVVKRGGGWWGQAGPTVVYARAIELGHPNWTSGVRYPYLGPAITVWKAQANRQFAETLNRVIHGG